MTNHELSELFEWRRKMAKVDHSLREQPPRSPRWRQLVLHRATFEAGNVFAASFWQHPTGVRVISALENADYPDGSGVAGPQWHISIARPNRRPNPVDVRRSLAAFGMTGTEEDNHHPGIARHYWLPVDPARRTGCECKVTEETIVDRDGYTWTNPKPESGEECRGCEMATWPAPLGKPCPIHGAAEASP